MKPRAVAQLEDSQPKDAEERERRYRALLGTSILEEAVEIHRKLTGMQEKRAKEKISVPTADEISFTQRLEELRQELGGLPWE